MSENILRGGERGKQWESPQLFEPKKIIEVGDHTGEKVAKALKEKLQKPPVLSDDEMFNMREEQSYKTRDAREGLACLICGNRNACTIFRHQPTKQNGEPRGDVCSISLGDADRVIAYYEPIIWEKAGEMLLWLEEHRHQDLAQGYHRFLATPAEYEDFKVKFSGEFISLIQQAKAEVAREIKEGLEKALEANEVTWGCDCGCWQDFWSKYMEGN